MNTRKRIKFLLNLAVTAVFCLTAASLNAATCSSSPQSPGIDNFDIANYGTSTGTDKWWAENSAAGSCKGQTFITPDLGVKLNSISYQVTSSQKAEPTKTYVIRVGTVVDNVFTEIHSETATQDFFWPGGEYMTWKFDSPVTLLANTVYGIDVGMTESTSGWRSGIPYLNMTGNAYPDGVRYTSGTNGVGTETVNLDTGRDRIFHIDLTSADPTAPIVDAGDDWATWLGEPVKLEPSVTANDPNNPEVVLIYNWTAEEVPGLIVDISDPSVEAPTVTITAEVPSVLEQVTLTLTVNNEGSATAVASDIVVIDVYENACELTKGLTPSEMLVTDMNIDCVTNLADFVELAAGWLKDYELIAAMPK